VLEAALLGTPRSQTHLSYYAGKRVLITGGLGFIGSNLALRLLDLDAEVLLVDALIPDTGGNAFNVEMARDHPQLAVRKADVRDTLRMERLVQGQDIIFNLAGQVSHVDSMRDPFTDLEINCRSQLALLEACRHNAPEVKVLFASTRQIYGRVPADELPVNEQRCPNPVDVNGINKLAGERYHILYNNVYGIRTCVLRLTNTYGPRMLVKNSRQTFIGCFVRQAVDGEEIQLFGDGSQLRDLTYVEDVAEAFLMAGAMSPMGLAGTLAQQTAEALAGIALIQLIRPGAPCIYGSFLTNLDMQSGSPAFGTPESAMGILASAQMARHYRIPFRGGGALTSSKSPDAQAAYESMMCLWPTVMGGVHFVLHAAGWLESALLASYEKFIIDVEALRMFEWILTKGIPFDDEGFAMDGIREVGPGGHHLGSEHTMRHYRTGFYRPWISSTENYDRWQRMGSRTADKVANEKWKQLLTDYKDPGIDSAVDEQLKTFIEVRKDAILHARV